MTILYVLLLIVGLVLLIKGADLFVDTSSKIARIFKISELLIGMTLVCFGTSLPELILSITSSLRGNAELVIGNMVGTNIFNMCAILGLISIMTPIMLVKETVRKDMYMSLVTGIVFLCVVLDTFLNVPGVTVNVISRADGIILLVFFGIFLYYTFYNFGGITEKRRKRREEKEALKLDKTKGKRQKEPKMSPEDTHNLLVNILLAVLGCLMVYVGSEFVIKGVNYLGDVWNLSDTFMAIMIIAVGTSLPEIATSIAAIRKGSINIAIGNLIGSNMFNMLCVTGIAAVVNPLYVVSTAIWIDCLFFILITLVIVTNAKLKFLNKGRYELSRTEGIVLLGIYITYVIYVVFRG